MIKKIISNILIVCFFISLNQMVYAHSTYKVKENNQILDAKVAYVNDVNATGTNLISDVSDGNKNLKTDIKLRISVSADNLILIKSDINGNDVSLKGFPSGRSQNGKVVYFNGEISDTTYSIVNFSYEENIEESSMYFTKNKGFNKASKASNMLKIYLKENNTRDYILLEAFNLKPLYDEEFIDNLEVNSLLGSWAAREFEPIETYFGEEKKDFTPMAYTTTATWVCTKTFFQMGEESTHTIRWRTSIDFSNVPVGQEAYQYFRLTVYDKNCRFSVNTNYNSDSESYLHVDALTIDQSSIPYCAWKSTKIDGDVRKTGFGGSLSADIGVNYGVLNLTYSFPLSFSNVGSVDIDDTYNSFENVNGNYTRNISLEMDRKFMLTNEGHYFEVRSALRDYGNVTRAPQLMKSRFHVDIINGASLDVYPYICNINAYVGIN